MPFARSQVLLWKFLHQNRCNIYTNMHRKLTLFPAMWLVGHNSTILIPPHSVLRSPVLVEADMGFLETDIITESYCDIIDSILIS